MIVLKIKLWSIILKKFPISSEILPKGESDFLSYGLHNAPEGGSQWLRGTSIKMLDEKSESCAFRHWSFQ